MADSAFKTMYRNETISSYEQHQSLLRQMCSNEAMIEGNAAVFQVAGSGGATAVTRGLDGRIPSRADDLTQTTVTLQEWHDVVEKTRFNIFSSQGDQRAIMQRTTVGVINRKCDDIIITELNTGTNDTGTADTASMSMVMHAKTILGNNDVPFDGRIHAAITPAFEAYLMQVAEFQNAEIIDVKPVPNANLAWNDTQKVYRWVGVNWMVHPNLPGKGTAAEKCFMWHQDAIGHAFNASDMDMDMDYDGRNDLSWVRCSGFMAAEILQNSGVVVMNHDGSAFAAQ